MGRCESLSVFVVHPVGDMLLRRLAIWLVSDMLGLVFDKSSDYVEAVPIAPVVQERVTFLVFELGDALDIRLLEIRDDVLESVLGEEDVGGCYHIILSISICEVIIYFRCT